MADHDPIKLTPKGLYCPAGDFYVDPWKPVPTAVITHAHSDHARSGSAQYIATRASESLLRKRLGAAIELTSLSYGETVQLGSALVSLHPAGHILGSAQVRIEVDGQVWVISGDFKREADPTCAPFEVVPCDVFITEATFGLPIYRWQPTEVIARDIYRWWMHERERGRNALLACYALGKAQRLLAALSHFTEEPVFVHGATDVLVSLYREAGITMLATEKVSQDKLKGALVLAPPSALQSPWARRFGDASTGFASGWMLLRNARRQRGYERGFVVSDHADWPALVATAKACQARRILVTHGFSAELSRYFREIGLPAEPLSTLFEGEADE